MRVLILEVGSNGSLPGRLESVLLAAGAASAGAEGAALTRWPPGGRRLPERRDLVARIREFRPGLVFLCVSEGCRPEVDAVLSAVGEAGDTGTPCRVILAAASIEPEEMCRLVECGATDFVLEPFSVPDLATRLLRFRREAESPGVATGGGGAGHPAGLQHLLGGDPGWRREVEKIPLLAGCAASVLILGETGTGKELCARAIHQLGPRRDRPFTPVNCGAIPPELVENELFGHTCGAYTGAVNAATGIVQAADGGTLFLDEVDALPLGVQVKFLRFLQSKEFRQVGGARLCRADVRIVAASNTDLSAAVRSGRFRSDLFYRLNVMLLRLPPLRSRVEDIPVLARHFMDRFAEEYGKPLACLSVAALSRLTHHDWPGNIRELENVMERAVIVAQSDRIEARDISLDDQGDADCPMSFKAQKARAVAAFERTYLQTVLAANDGNITRAARAAQKNRRAFWELIRKHRLRVVGPNSGDPDADAS